MSTGTIEFYCEHPCASCSRGGEPVGDDFYVDVREVQANAHGGGWMAKGEGVSRCPRCGAMVRMITHRVPLELRGLPCSQSHEAVDFRVELSCVTTDGRRFDFTASVTCPVCTRKSVFRKLIESLSRVRRIQVGPTGVELELESGARSAAE
jgi:hypothetical protein